MEHTVLIGEKLLCTFCDKLKSKNGWLQHTIACQRIKSVNCPIVDCDIMFHPVVESEEHFATFHSFPKCPRCFETFPCRGNWVKHVKACQDREYLLCPHPCCDFIALKTSLVTNHLEKVHDGMFCNRHFNPLRLPNLKDLRAHLAYCLTGNTPYSCTVCQMGFKTATQLAKHWCANGEMRSGAHFLECIPSFFLTPSHSADLFFMSRVSIVGSMVQYDCAFEPYAFRFIPCFRPMLGESVLHRYRPHLASFLLENHPAELWFLLVYETIEVHNQSKSRVEFPQLSPPKYLQQMYGPVCSDFIWIKGHCLVLLQRLQNREKMCKMVYSSSALTENKGRDATILFSAVERARERKDDEFSMQILPLACEDDERGAAFAQRFWKSKEHSTLVQFEKELLATVFIYLQDFYSYHMTVKLDFSIIRGIIGDTDFDEFSSEDDDSSSDTSSSVVEDSEYEEADADFPMLDNSFMAQMAEIHVGTFMEAAEKAVTVKTTTSYFVRAEREFAHRLNEVGDEMDYPSSYFLQRVARGKPATNFDTLPSLPHHIQITNFRASQKYQQEKEKVSRKRKINVG